MKQSKRLDEKVDRPTYTLESVYSRKTTKSYNPFGGQGGLYEGGPNGIAFGPWIIGAPPVPVTCREMDDSRMCDFKAEVADSNSQ